MEMKHLTTLASFAEALPELEGEDSTYDLGKGEMVALKEAIAGIKEEVTRAHKYATNTEQGVLDVFVFAGISAGHDVPTAYRLAMEAMKARTQLIEQRVDILLEKASKEEADSSADDVLENAGEGETVDNG